MNQRTSAPIAEPAPAAPVYTSLGHAERQAQDLGATAAWQPARSWQPAVPERAAEPLPQVASAGEPLAQPVRTDAERRLGFDLSGVRIHRDPVAERFADSQDANAVTIGGDVYFGRGTYAPESTDGRRLLTHELVHTVQQTQVGLFVIQRDAKREAAQKRKRTKQAAENASKMSDAEKAEARQKVEGIVDEASAAYITKVDARPELALLSGTPKAKFDQMKGDLASARKSAQGVADPADRAARLALLDAALAVTTDKYFVYGVIDGVLPLSKSISKIGDPAFKPTADNLALWADETALLKTGGKGVIRAYVREWAWEKVEEQTGFTREMLKTEEKTEAEQKTSGGSELTFEDKQRLQEIYSAVPPDSGGGSVTDQKVLAEKLRNLSDADLEQLKEFLRQRPPGPDEEITPIEELIDKFKKLTPAERDTLMINRDLNADNPAKAKLDSKILLDLGKADAPVMEAAAKFDSNAAQIAALVTDPEKLKDYKPIGVDVGLFAKELAFFRGLLGGGASQSDLVRGAVTDLTAQMARAQKELQEELLVEAAVTGAMLLIPLAGQAKFAAMLVRLEMIRRKIDKIRKAYAIIDEVKSFIDFLAGLPEQIDAFRAFIDKAAIAYTTYLPMLEQLEDMPDLDEKIAEIEDGMAEKFEELLEGKFGEILERFYIAPDTPPAELLKIIYTLPQGVDALQGAWDFYWNTTDATPDANERILIRAAKAGVLLYPVVGFLAAFAAERIGAAFPDLSIFDRVVNNLAGYQKDKGKRREKNRGSFFRLNRRNFDYNEADLNPYWVAGLSRLDEFLEKDEPGQHWIASWLRVSLREEVKKLNSDNAKVTVPAKVKQKRNKGSKQKAATPATTKEEKAPLPPFRLKFSRLDRDPKNETVELSLNPRKKKTFDTLSYDDFKKGVPYKVAGKAKRERAVKDWLEDRDYRVNPDNDKKPHVRLRDGKTDIGGRVYLHIDSTSTPVMLRAGIKKDDYKKFLGRVVESSDDLPEGFYLKASPSGAVVARKSGVRSGDEAPPLGLNEKGELIDSPGGKLPPQVTAPLGVTKPGEADLEPYDWQESLRVTLSGGDYNAQDGTASTWNRRAGNTKWGDMKKRPKRVSGEVGYVLRARAFGDSLGSIFPPELKKSDDKGHLIAKRFGGDDHLNNVIPMKRSVNQYPGKWYDLESDMAKVYGKGGTPGHRLWLSIEIDYPPYASRRPSRFRVEWKELASKGGSPVSGKGSGRKLTIQNG